VDAGDALHDQQGDSRVQPEGIEGAGQAEGVEHGYTFLLASGKWFFMANYSQ
jgi:hypothetical protein